MSLYLGALLGMAVGVVVGFTFAAFFKVGLANDHAILNNFRKQAVRCGPVAEMIAPGEHAEVVETSPDVIGTGFTNKCFGCRYAGRYVFTL